MRKPIIAGNWKMNNTVTESIKFVEELKALDLNKDVESLVCVPYTSLYMVAELLKDTDIKLGAQNMHWEEKGAFTGEISPLMLNDIGVDYCILGHSERRQYFEESDEIVNKKIHSALSHGIKAILCVGESLEEREEGREELVVERQIVEGLNGVEEIDMDNLVIAYEPIWAIGTGKTASSDDANKMCAFIRETVKNMYSEEVGEKLRIQYGGSVKPTTIDELMAKSDVDGALVGGASLLTKDFTRLINFK